MRRHHGRALSPYAGRVPTPLSAEVNLVRTFDSQFNPTRPVRQSPLATSQIQGMPLDLIDRIRSFPLFKGAPDSFLYEIGLLLKPQMHAINDYIMTEGDDAKAMYWIVRGAVAVTSRDGESTYAELKPGSFVGEIGILMDRPRTATVVAKTKCLTLQLKKEDLRKLLPKYPDIERAIREEALERLAITEKKKKQGQSHLADPSKPERRGSKRARENSGEEMDIDQSNLANGVSKRRKSPSPSGSDLIHASALGNGLVSVRTLLKELPLFANLPPEPLHFLGLNAVPRSFAPFKNIIKEGLPGREVYFIARGDVEVLSADYSSDSSSDETDRSRSKSPELKVRARLKAGQYFGEVASLSLVDRRTATVRSVSQVECLVIPEAVLDEFWSYCPPNLKRHMEDTARQRLREQQRQQQIIDKDVRMLDAHGPPDMNDLEIADHRLKRGGVMPPRVTFHDSEATTVSPPNKDEPTTVAEPSDPDPFSSALLDSVRSRSRRGSLAPLPPDEPAPKPSKATRRSPRESPKSSPMGSPIPASSPSPRASPRSSAQSTPSPVSEKDFKAFPFTDPFLAHKRPPAIHRPTMGQNRGNLPDEILPLVLTHFQLHELMRLRVVSLHWQNVLAKSPLLLRTLDLSQYNRHINDQVLMHRIAPFVGHRPRIIDISNCFHLTDEGFTVLAELCGNNVQQWRMKSVWDVTANAVLEMSTRAKNLHTIDLSNCRKVSDALLARVIGWVVPPYPSSNNQQITSTTLPSTNSLKRGPSARGRPAVRTKQITPSPDASTPPPGTTIGCPSLSSITLSYCKHITDRTMHHLAQHAAPRLQHLDLTRCTSITDTGFNYWQATPTPHKFSSLHTLILADCTYLSDQAIIFLINAAGPALRTLDLSFCCALSDTSTEVIALGCPNLESLDMSFCGSAVSDASLRSVGNHLSMLRRIGVRGCVRVTGVGVDAVVGGCKFLESADVSQCKNLVGWVEAGGRERWWGRGRNVHFEMVR